MAAKRSTANYNNCNALKTAMLAKGLYPALKSDDVCYDGGINDTHLLHGQAEDGWFRTLNIINGALSFDFIDPSDANIVRAWSVREVYVLASQIEGVTSQSSTLNGSTWTYSIVRNGTTYSKTGNSEANAAVQAFTGLVNAL